MDAAKRLAGRTWRHFMHDSLYRNSLFLMANTAVLAGFGFLFWTLAARLYDAGSIGIVSTLISAGTLMATLSFLGFDYALIKFLPSSGKTFASKVHSSFTLVAAVSLVLGALYLLFVPLFVPNLNFLHSSVYWAVGFELFVLGTVWNTLTNTVFIAFRAAHYALLASLALTVLKIPLLIVLQHEGEEGLFLTQILPLAVCVALSFWFMYRSMQYKYKPKISKTEIRTMAGYSFGTYVANVAGGLPPLILPAIILKMLGAEEAAYYYMVIMMATLLNIIPQATSQSLFAEGSWSPQTFHRQLVKATKAMLAVMVPAIVALVACGYLLLSIFGREYAEHGYLLLVFISLTALPKILSYVCSTILRVNGRIKPLMVVAGIGTLVTIGLSIAGMALYGNLVAVGVATFVSELVVASGYAAVAFRTFRRDRAAEANA